MILGRIKKRQPPVSFSWKRGKKFFFFFAFISSIIIFLNQFNSSLYFPIKQVSVYGIKHLDQIQVQHLLTPLVKKGFFAVQVELIKDSLLQIPWVEDVSVSRIWPDKVFIHIAERTPIARWNSTSLLSTTGEIFNPAENTYPMNLPELVGPEGEQIQILQHYVKLNHLLQGLNLEITRLEFTPYLSWNITCNNGIKINVGYKDILTRISHFVKVYPKIVGERAADVDYVDLRYPNGLAVRWKTVT